MRSNSEAICLDGLDERWCYTTDVNVRWEYCDTGGGATTEIWCEIW